MNIIEEALLKKSIENPDLIKKAFEMIRKDERRRIKEQIFPIMEESFLFVEAQTGYSPREEILKIFNE